MKQSKQIALAFIALVIATAVDAAPLDSESFRLYGGTYSAKCNDPQAQHLQILADRISVIRGSKQLVAKNVEAQFDYFGNSPPRDFQVALMGQVRPNIGLLFLLYKDKRGLYIEIDGHPQVLQALGQRSDDTTHYYECSVIRK